MPRYHSVANNYQTSAKTLLETLGSLMYRNVVAPTDSRKGCEWEVYQDELVLAESSYQQKYNAGGASWQGVSKRSALWRPLVNNNKDAQKRHKFVVQRLMLN